MLFVLFIFLALLIVLAEDAALFLFILVLIWMCNGYC